MGLSVAPFPIHLSKYTFHSNACFQFNFVYGLFLDGAPYMFSVVDGFSHHFTIIQFPIISHALSPQKADFGHTKRKTQCKLYRTAFSNINNSEFISIHCDTFYAIVALFFHLLDKIEEHFVFVLLMSCENITAMILFVLLSKWKTYLKCKKREKKNG